MAKGREFETILNFGGSIDPSLGSAIDAAVKRLEQISESATEAAGAAGKLTDKIQKQEKVLRQAEAQYASFVLAGEENTEQAQELAREIQELARELNNDKRAFKAAEQAAERLADSMDDTDKRADDLGDGLDDVGRAARGTKDGFTVMKGALANLVSTGITRVIDGIGNMASSIYGLADSTQEYREDIGKLKTAWESAGQSTELATNTYKNFYSVLGEEDRSVEAVNHLAKFVDTEQDMAKWTDIATGVWGTFGDSLPIEGLTEAANETAKVGKLTGVLADALNWAGVNEDDFQAKLDRATTEQERAQIITETLSGLYTEAAENYRENNASIIEARMANSDYTDSLAEMGERIEPVTTAVKNGLNTILQKALELTGKADWEAISLSVAGGMEKVADMMQFVADNADILIPLVAGLTAGMLAYKAANIAVGESTLIAVAAEKASAIAHGIKTGAITASTVATTAATAATWAFNGAMAVLTSPITAVVVAIGALVAAGVYLWRNWDTVKEKAAQLGGFLTEKWDGIKTSTKKAVDGIVGWFKSGFDSLVGIVMGPINKITGMIDGVKDKFNSFKSGVSEKISGAAEKVSGWLPKFAAGGFTRGVSIAGEAGTEAVISFDPAYREQNLSYWARAGRLLGATAEDGGFSLFGSSGGGTSIDFGGVTFAPNITVAGNADKQTILEAIEAEYPEFTDLLDRWAEERRRTVYA